MMIHDRNSLEKLSTYFDLRAKTSANSLYANGYSAQFNEVSEEEHYNQAFDELKSALKILPGSKVLDIGCGTGEFLVRLNSVARSAQGVDLSREMVSRAQGKGLDAKLYDGGKLPFPDESFDCVVIYSVFINLPSLSSASYLIEEACRVVRKGGEIFIGAVPHPLRSRIPTHKGNWHRKLKRVIGIKDSIQYFAYDYSFFMSEFDRLGLSQISILPCRLERSGWNTKFHVMYRR